MEKTSTLHSVKQEQEVLNLEEARATKKSSEDLQREAEEKKIFDRLTKAEHRERFPRAHYDERWGRTVWYCEREKRYKPRDPSKEIQWKRPVGWRPESVEEKVERELFIRLKIWRLNQRQARVGSVYNYFGQPDNQVMIIEKCYKTAPQVLVIPFPSCDREQAEYIFADELEAKRHRPFFKRRYKKKNNQRKNKPKGQEQGLKEPGELSG